MASGQQPAIFIADAPALDFLNSIATPVDTEIDWIEDGEGFLRWLEQARLVPPEALKALRARAKPGEFDGVAAQARTLRKWFRKFVDDRRGRPLGADVLKDLGPLNRLLERDERFDRIVADHHHDDGSVLELRSTRRWKSPESLLLPIAAELAKFVCEEDFSDVKACEGPACTLLFADHTRGRARRWCSMAICGNRAKQAAHRQRLKAGS
ncbi:ABATE domain-containing protein [Bradyrhizobium sp. S69]|uniref:CGNR zinc finger domain-containing protein n=1 Tax=Bradyrhizobium sp. S69 TaxID=1641856 RepID=UPI00131B17E4|nr:ABATE domain-containing protein [Bradyrhizobium sp. S69]